MHLATALSLYAGGPGSGCQGPHCGRPRTKSDDPREFFEGIPPPPQKELAKGESTEEAYKDSLTGEWDKGREAYHQAIADRMIEGITPAEGRPPEAIVMGGGQAVGKSTVSRKIVGDNPNLVRVDADELKVMIPEWEGLKQTDPVHAAALVHEESFLYSQTGVGQSSR